VWLIRRTAQNHIPTENLMATTSFTTFDSDYLAVHAAP
jgi:hypothetical protein